MVFGIIPTPLFLLGLFVLIAAGIMAAIMSYKPSNKHGNSLRATRKLLTHSVKTSNVTKAIPTLFGLAGKKLMDKIAPAEQKPSYQPNNYQQKSKENVIKLNPTTNEKPVLRGTNEFENAPFHYDTTNPDDQINCGDFRLGDVYDGKYVAFVVVPYTYKGQLYLGLERPHMIDDKPKTYPRYDDQQFYSRSH